MSLGRQQCNRSIDRCAVNGLIIKRTDMANAVVAHIFDLCWAASENSKFKTHKHVLLSNNVCTSCAPNKMRWQSARTRHRVSRSVEQSLHRSFNLSK